MIEVVKNRIKIVPNPAKIDRVRPATRGSLINLKNIAVNHIKRGCLPSVRGMNLSVSTLFII